MSDHALIAIIGAVGTGLQTAVLIVIVLQVKEARQESRTYFEALREEMRITRQESRRMVRAFIKRLMHGHQN